MTYYKFVTHQSLLHDHISQQNIIEASKRNDITIIYFIYVNLKDNTWPLEQVNDTVAQTSNLAYIKQTIMYWKLY